MLRLTSAKPRADAPDNRTAEATAAPRAVQAETALRCLVRAASHHGIDLSAEGLRHAHSVDDSPITPAQLLRMAKKSGLRARTSTLNWDALTRLRGAFPALARLENGNWVLVLGLRQAPAGEVVLNVFDPLADRPEAFDVTKAPFCKRWSGDVLVLKRDQRQSGPAQKFGFRWFIPELVRERRLFFDVAVAAVLLYGLGLVLPIFFQLVIDKVLVHESFITLYVLLIGASIALLFDAVFTFLRRYLLLYATNKIDIRIATKTFGHLLSLPNGFFERISAGVLVKHMQQAARIREFLTGRLFLTALDSLSLVVFVPVLALYSINLTLLVLTFTALSGIVIVALMGPFRRRLYSLYQAESGRQALLVETVHGMQTVKSLAMEPMKGTNWDDRCAAAIVTRSSVEKISAAAQAVTGLLEKLMMLGIIGYGAILVFNGEMTIGTLVAFNMLATRVSGPLVQMVTMVHEYQEISLAVRMLAEVMNQTPERDGKSDGLRPESKGAIEFDRVSFRYSTDGPQTLSDVSFSIPAGSVFGIVGRSGSGKTTITRLLARLYTPQDGMVRIDGLDAREIDLTYLRKSLGIVLQDSFLFRGTVRENIACVKRGATFAEIVRAAQIAGADEFIERLPRGYDTLLEENASNLSGGQKQRLAIARALISDPRVLIFDEATSALDSESEVIVRRNLQRIAQGRTVIIVSHRLSMLTGADNILVLEQGHVVGLGRHEQLLSKCATYTQFWNQQVRQVA
jgi:ATP-binding cassette subfamily B protein